MIRLLLALLLLSTPAWAQKETFKVGSSTADVTVTVLPSPTKWTEGAPSVQGVLTWAVYSKKCTSEHARQHALLAGNYRGCQIVASGSQTNYIPDAGLTFMRDAFVGTTSLSAYRYHCMGTSSQAVAATDTGCVTQFFRTLATTNQASGSFVFRTVAVTGIVSSATLTEWALMSAATGGTIWSRIVLAQPGVSVTAGQQVTTDYQLTLARP